MIKIIADRINFNFKGLEIFGIIITTRKQLENCPINIYASIKTETKKVNNYGK